MIESLAPYLVPALIAIVVFVALLFVLNSQADKTYGRPLKMLRRRFLPEPAGSTIGSLASPYLVPRRATKDAAGYDLFLRHEAVLLPGVPRVLPTGVHMEIPEGLFGMVRPRGSASKKGIHCVGTIDSDYRGDICVVATNLTPNPIIVPQGTAIAQMILVPYMALPIVEVDSLPDSVRQDRGFGSSGLAVK